MSLKSVVVDLFLQDEMLKLEAYLEVIKAKVAPALTAEGQKLSAEIGVEIANAKVLLATLRGKVKGDLDRARVEALFLETKLKSEVLELEEAAKAEIEKLFGK